MLELDRNLQIQDLTGPTDFSPFRVGILPVPGFALMSYACTVEPLRAANLLSDSELYEIVHFSSDGRVPSSGAAVIERTCRPGDAEGLDLLLVVAGGDPVRVRGCGHP